MGDRQALKTFWEGFSDTPNVETMMLNKNADDFDENDRRDIWTSLPDLKGLRVVEIGSGIGRFTAALANVAKHVLATDFVQSFIEKNEEDNGHLGNVSFKCGDAAHLDLEPENCDFVFTNWLLMYLTDVEVCHFLESVLLWLTPNGYLHFRESCSESSKRTITQSNDPSNPTHYRHICQYLTLLEKIRVRDHKTGRLMRFEVLWAKSVETYVRRPSEKVIPNWRQIHMLLRKVWADEKDCENESVEDAAMVRVLGEIALEGKQKFEHDMAARFDLWGGRSPLEQFLLKCLQEKEVSSSSTILSLFCNNSATVSPFAIAEAFGCSVRNLDTCYWTYDYNLAQANAKGDKRLRFHYIPGWKNDSAWQYLPQRHFDMAVDCIVSNCVEKLENAVPKLSEKLKPGGQIVILGRLCGNGDASLDSFKSKVNGNGSVDAQDVTNPVNSLLMAAITQMDRTPELQPLQHEYQAYLQEECKWYVISIEVN